MSVSGADLIVVGAGPTGLVATFKRDGADFVVADGLDEPVAGMNALTSRPLLDPAEARRTAGARDRQPPNGFTQDLRLAAIRDFRNHRGARPMRTVAPHRLLDRKAGPKAGPLIAVRLHVLTRKPPGGLHTEPDRRVRSADGQPAPGLHAADGAAGSGGGDMHGHRALEGTFLGGGLFSGRQAVRTIGYITKRGTSR